MQWSTYRVRSAEDCSSTVDSLRIASNRFARVGNFNHLRDTRYDVKQSTYLVKSVEHNVEVVIDLYVP